MLYGGVELGGTKVVCALGRGPDAIVALTTIPTTTPEETLARVIAFFHGQREQPAALGIASFGPLGVDPEAANYGRILATPKLRWSGFDLYGALTAALNRPVAIDTDVNCAALGEWTWGAARGLTTFSYVTVGTGIGAGGMANGALLHGRGHTEFGHSLLPHDRATDPFAGACPFHGDCLEGLASGPAIAARWNVPAHDLPDDHAAWAIEARYLAAALLNLLYTSAPQRIVIGGGVLHRASLLRLIRRFFRELDSGYSSGLDETGMLDAFIVPPALGDRAGVLGAIALAQGASRR
jgi:fructokinase